VVEEAGDQGDSRHCRWSAALAVGRSPRESTHVRRPICQDVAGKPSTADERRKLVALRDEGAISTADYEQAKAEVLA
jgi:hypothetical protein